MSYKLSAKLVPFLPKKGDKFIARLVGGGSKNAVLELDEGVSVKVKPKDLGVDLGNSTGADLEFDKDGVLLTATVDPTPKPRTELRGSSGSARPRQISQF